MPTDDSDRVLAPEPGSGTSGEPAQGVLQALGGRHRRAERAGESGRMQDRPRTWSVAV